ncbi:unnamed protein product, partial [Rotaria sp. Silwood1]
MFEYQLDCCSGICRTPYAAPGPICSTW